MPGISASISYGIPKSWCKETAHKSPRAEQFRDRLTGYAPRGCGTLFPVEQCEDTKTCEY